MTRTRQTLMLLFIGDICPPGGYCLAGAENVNPCPPGHYNPREGATSSSACIVCPLGSYCDGHAVTKGGIAGPCQEGYYCLEGSSSAASVAAPQGYFAPPGSSSPLACYPGTYQTNSGSASCLPCPAGLYCQTLAMTTATGCPESSYCPQGSVAPQLCPVGTYSNDTNLESEDDCQPCPAGKYCGDRGLKAPSGDCQAGFYCGGGSGSSAPLEQSGPNQLCPEGFFCPAGSSSPKPCPAGTYSPSRQAISSAACLPCDPGMSVGLCLNIKLFPKLDNPITSSRNIEADPDTSFSASCGILRVCSSPGSAAPDGVCPAGSFCPKGKKATLCPKGHECPAGSAAPAPCKHVSIGRELVGLSRPFMTIVCYYHVTALRDRESSQMLRVQLSAKCVRKVTIARTRLSHLKKVSNVPADSFALRARRLLKSTLVRRHLGCIHSLAWSIASKAEVQFEAHARPGCTILAALVGGQATPCEGFDGSLASFAEAESLCLSVNECEGILETSDGAFFLRCGNYSKEGGRSRDFFHPKHCVVGGICEPGTYCPSGSEAPQQCPAGKYCAGYALSETSGDCDIGYACPAGSTSPHPYSALCPPGHYCAEEHVPVACPVGKVLSGRGGSSEDDCLPCPPGYYCDTVGRAAPTGPCPAGEACPVGAKEGKPCPSGFICPEGVAIETSYPCPPGTYAPPSDLRASPCIPCPAGYYCESAGSTVPTAPCTGAPSPLIAGTGFGGTGGEGLPAPQSYLMLPSNTVMDPITRDIYIADFKNFAIKRISGSTGRNAVVKYDVNSGSFSVINSISSTASKPLGLALDSGCKYLYVADSANDRILKYALENSALGTIAGSNAVEQLLSNQLNLPSAVAISGNLLYIADTGNRRVGLLLAHCALLMLEEEQNAHSLHFKSKCMAPEIFLYCTQVVEVDVTQPQTVRTLAGEGAAAPAGVDALPGGAQEASEMSLEMPVSVALADDQSESVRPIKINSIILETLQVVVELKDIYDEPDFCLTEAAKRKVAETGLEAAFNGISPFYEESSSRTSTTRTGVLFADTYMQRIRRIDLHKDLYNAPAVIDVPCPAGTYLPYTGAASKDECKPCPYGMYCGETGLEEPQGPCDAGYYCPPGSTRPTAEQCSAGHYCIPHTELTNVTTDLEAASKASTATSGWFRIGAKTAYRSIAGLKQPSCLDDAANEEVLVLELERPMDLISIRIDSKLNQPPMMGPQATGAACLAKQGTFVPQEEVSNRQDAVQQ
ncbi:hypothetical protein ACSSS7_002807 [Eimeria intestinalis]